MIDVGTEVVNRGRGDWKVGTVVGRVPPGENGRRTAEALGLEGARTIPDTPARAEASWIVELVDNAGKRRLRWPFVSGLVEAGSKEEARV